MATFGKIFFFFFCFLFLLYPLAYLFEIRARFIAYGICLDTHSTYNVLWFFGMITISLSNERKNEREKRKKHTKDSMKFLFRLWIAMIFLCVVVHLLPLVVIDQKCWTFSSQSFFIFRSHESNYEESSKLLPFE